MLWGVDLGGTKIEAVVMPGTESAEPLIRQRIPTEGHKGLEHILGQIEILLRRVQAESGLPWPAAIGFGTPGTLDPGTGLLKNSNTLCLNGQPLDQLLRERLGCEILVANDANCFAVAESVYGAARGRRCVFGVILGTGVGGGVCFEGRAWGGLHGIGGEWGHNSVDPNGRLCYCGHRGCLETTASGPALELTYKELTGQAKSLKEIVAEDSESTRKVMDQLVSTVGLSLARLINILDPEAIVLGGGIGQIPLLYERLPAEIEKHIFNPVCQTPILRPELGDSAGVFGAAQLTAP